MPGAIDGLQAGNIDLDMILTVNIAAGTVGTTTIVNVTVSVPGILKGDFAAVSPQQYNWAASQPALNIDPGNAYVGTNGILTVCFQNATGAALTQTTALPYSVNIARSGNYQINQTYPTAVV
jgi:hypothetical protein